MCLRCGLPGADFEGPCEEWFNQRPTEHYYLRQKERRVYTDQDIDDDEIEGKRLFSIEEKLNSPKYNASFVITRDSGEGFNVEYFQKNGFSQPHLVLNKTGLGMRLPSKNFKVSDVKQCVGSRRNLDVMDVTTQKALEMTMKEWVHYYENTERERLLNVISLEFSHTRLENYVDSPTLVRDVDWVDNVWPRHLKQCQSEATNILEKMKYPKVQKYCLMSVKGCYTDFHVDFGGTSVWYHILHGEKIFWLIPPTEENIELYEAWTLSGKQGDMFFADQVKSCQRIRLQEGHTFFIPTGWIHGVYTPKDSLVFGGNFIHSYNIPQQLRVIEIESRTRVPNKFRYPFFNEMCWYALERYVSILCGVHHRIPTEEEEVEEKSYKQSSKRDFTLLHDDEKSNDSKASDESKASEHSQSNGHGNDSQPQSPLNDEHTYGCSPKRMRSPSCSPKPGGAAGPKSPSSYESRSPKSSSGPASPNQPRKPGRKPKQKPDDEKSISQSVSGRELSVKLEKVDVGCGVVQVKSDNMPLVKAQKVLTKWEQEGLQKLIDYVVGLPPTKKGVPKDIPNPEKLLEDAKNMLVQHADDDHELAVTGFPVLQWPPSSRKSKPKVKTTTYYVPKSSTAKGGLKKQDNNIRRRRTRCKKCEPCTRPDCAECNFCKDMKKFGGPGKMKQSCVSRQCMAPVLPNCAVCLLCDLDVRVKAEGGEEMMTTTLMECGICWEILHPACLTSKSPDITNEGVISEDLPNSWECPKCCDDGKKGMIKPRVLKGGLKRRDSHQSSNGSEESGSVPDENEPDTANKPEGATTTVVVAKPSSIPQNQSKKQLRRGEKEVERIERESRRSSRSPDVAKVEIKSETKSLPETRKRREQLAGGGGDAESSPIKKKVKVEDVKGSFKVKEGVSRPSPSTTPKTGTAGRTTTRGRETDRSKTGDVKKPLSGPPRSIKNEMASPLMRSSSRSPKPGPSRDCVAAGGAGGGERKGGGGGGGGEEGGGSGGEDGGGVDPEDGSEGRSLRRSPRVTSQAEKRKHPSGGFSTLNAPLKQLRVVLERHVVRPAPISPPPKEVMMDTGLPHPLDINAWTKVFTHLNWGDLCRCMRVCRTFNRWTINHKLWASLDLRRTHIRQPHLVGIVRRQPSHLDISWTNISKKQLLWLVARLPLLKHLNLGGCSWSAVSCLCSSNCPRLLSLDLQWVEGLKDSGLKELVNPPIDHRPAVDDSISRLRRTTTLSLEGTDITDLSLKAIARNLPCLQKLNIRLCTKITNAGLEHLCSDSSLCSDTIAELDLNGCHKLTDVCLSGALAKFPALVRVDLGACPHVTVGACKNFTASSGKAYREVGEDKLLQVM